MNKGTLMVLKRYWTTVLGALGVGALASGTSFAQAPGTGNIPAPDMFNDQIACVDRVPVGTMGALAGFVGETEILQPTRVPTGQRTSPLDDLISSVRDNAAEGSVINTLAPRNTNKVAEYADLVYTLPTMKCGDRRLESSPAFNTRTESLSIDVSEGYNALRATYEAVHHPETGTRRFVRDAQAAVDALVRAGTTGVALENAQTALANRQALDATATAKLTRETTGNIYKAAVAEWQAEAAVAGAVKGFNDALDKAAIGAIPRSGLRPAEQLFLGSAYDGKWVKLDEDNTNRIDALFYQADGKIKTGEALTSAVEAYIKKTGGEGGWNQNFDQNGNLVLPGAGSSRTSSGSNDTTPDYEATSMVSVVKRARDRANAARDALVKFQASNTDTNFTDEIAEAVRRATLEAAHNEAEYQRMLGDTTDLVEADNAFDSIAQRHTRYLAAQRVYDTAVTALKTAVAARENATRAVQNAFANPTDFHAQAVNRRQDLKAAADKLVTDAGANPPQALIDDATKANRALAAATKRQSDVATALGGEGSPTNPLIVELLKKNGDDGQALVDAVASNHTTANEAKKTADKVAQDVAGLTGTGGTVAQNTSDIATNKADIATNKADIATNTSDIATNKAAIETNEGNISTNTSDIATNKGMIETNTADIATNKTGIASNTAGIATNKGLIDTNTASIGMNTSAISDNATAISGLRGDIMSNSNSITGLQDQMEIVRAGVAASMALAGMPAINGRGISIGVGSFDGESAFAVGFQAQTEMASFKVGITSAGGQTGASAGVGFQF